MTALEIINEFRVKYDSASKGGPDINNYELSLFLTQAWKAMWEEAYRQYEKDPESKRIINSILSTINLTPGGVSSPGFSTDLIPVISHPSVFSITLTDDVNNLLKYNVRLSNKLIHVVGEVVKIKGCKEHIQIENVNIDHLSAVLNNPFKQPNKRKIVRVWGSNSFELYSISPILEYQMKYIKYPEPIIISNFQTDMDLFGDESIDGKYEINIPINIPEFLYRKIIDMAVILAIKYTRQNSLETQIKIN